MSAKDTRVENDRKLRFKRMEQFLTVYAQSGAFLHSARVARVHPNLVRTWLKVHPEFKEDYDLARGIYSETIQQELHRRAVVGIRQLKTVDKNGVAHYDTVYSDALLLAEAKRVNPEYREKTEVDVKDERQSVLVAPKDLSPEEFARLVAEKKIADAAHAAGDHA